MKSSTLILIVLTMFFGSAFGQTSVSTPNTTVFPTGVFPDDVANVQAAIDQGGVVLLKAVNTNGDPQSFNFGTAAPLPGRRVLINAPITIMGEQVGSNITTIAGGYIPFRCRVPVSSRIQGIDFEGPMGAAISVTNTSGIEIVNNLVNGVVPIHYPTFTFGDGIDVFGSTADAKVVVAGNSIANIFSDCCAAIQFDSVSAQSEIAGNTVMQVSANGILALRSTNSVLIANNFVTPGSQAIPGQGCIFVDGNQAATYTIVNNSVVCEGEQSDGIIVGGLFSDGTVSATVTGNHVMMHHSFSGGISLYGQVTASLVAQNTVEGESAVAFGIAEGLDPSQLGTLNRVRGNNISHFSSSFTDVYLGTNSSRNEVLGQCSAVADLGTSNFATCGRQSSEATPPKFFRSDSNALRQRQQQVHADVSLF